MPNRLSDFFNIVVLMLSKVDRLLLGFLWEGLIVIAGPGAGKSANVGRTLILALLKIRNLGALILVAKSEETQNWLRCAKEAGRADDVILFNAENGCFDPLHYEWTRKGRGAGDVESILEIFNTLGSISRPDAGHGQDPFWERGNEQLMRNVIKLLDLARERVSIVNIDRVIKSMPTRIGEHDDEQWQKESYCAQLINQVRARQDTLSPEQWSDLEFATQYIFKKWPAFDERPRSSLEMVWSGMADRFLFSPYNRLFCSGECSFTPEQTTHEGKIIICDCPLLEYGEQTGRFINVLLKLVFQRAWLRRDLSDSPNPVLLWQDEFQYFVTKRDNFFHETCRGARVAVVALTQNILAVSEALGETQPGSKTKSLLGNFATKVFMQQNEHESCVYAAEQIGKTYQWIQSYNASGGDQGSGSACVGASLQSAYIVEPLECSKLQKPDATNPLAESIVYQSGRTFNATKTDRNPEGHNFLRVAFSRE